MRKYEISPAVAAAMRSRALAASFQEAGIPLYLDLPHQRELAAPARFTEFDADDGRIEADVFVLGDEEDDDFY